MCQVSVRVRVRVALESGLGYEVEYSAIFGLGLG